MSPRLVGPVEAVGVVARALDSAWAAAVCAELTGESQAAIRCRLRPGVRSDKDVQVIGYDAWFTWHTSWTAARIGEVVGVECEHRDIGVAGNTRHAPLELRVESLAGAIELLRRFGHTELVAKIAHARDTALRMRDAGAILTSDTVRSVSSLPSRDAEAAMSAVVWLRSHPDLSGWTARQLPMPDVHTKWLPKHEGLVRRLAGRDVLAEVKPRLAVAHFTYVDPQYLVTGGRRHDAWTTGDAHEPAYRPRAILVVENRDCRLWFPPIPNTIVVEGGGDAAAASLAAIEWLTGADRIVYWGDIDSDGFGILNLFRAELRNRDAVVESMLMDPSASARYGHLGVNHDKRGNPLKPSARRLPELTDDEAACYASIATAGDVPFRRIEQERIPLAHAGEELARLLRP